MIRYLIYILWFTSVLTAFDPVADVNDNWQEQYDNSPETVRIRDLVIDDVADSASTPPEETKARDANKKIQLEQKSIESLNIQYFEPYFEYHDSTLSCPPIQEYYEKAFFVMQDGADYRNGTVTCSVFKNPFYGTGMSENLINASFLPNLEKIYTKTFQNHEYKKSIEQFSENEYKSYLDEEAVAATENYIEKLELSKQSLKYKYNNTSSQFSTVFNNESAINNNTTYLNLSDLIDSVMVFNTSIINVETSIKTGSLTLNNGFRLIYRDDDLNQQKQERRQQLASFTSELNEQYSWFPQFFNETTQSDVDSAQNDMVLIFESGLNMMLQWVVIYNYLFIDVLFVLLPFISVLAIFNIGKYLMESIGREDMRKNWKWKVGSIIGTSFAIIYLSIPSDFQVEDASGKVYDVGISTFQEYTALISMKTGMSPIN